MVRGKALELKELVRPYYLKWLYFHLAQKNCPPEFKRWREYPSAPLESSDHILDSPQDNRADAIFLPMTDWHGIRQRSQQLARGLSQLGHRCVYVNPHLGREFPGVYSHNDQARLSFLEPRIAELHVHLRREPVFHHRCLRTEEVDAISESLFAVFRSAGTNRQFSIVGLPVWTEVACRLRARLGTPIVYDCHDLLEGFQGIGPELLDREAELLEKADLVVFSADWLAQKHLSRSPKLAGKSAVIRNGVEAQHFAAVARSATREPVTIGYSGSLNSWFDIQAVTTAAMQHPEWRFLLVGPMAHAFPKNAFHDYKNIQAIGEVSYQDLPKWMSEFDAGIIPFLIQPLTMATNPVKMYEYFACGLPVVSSPLEEVKRYQGLAYLAETPGEFVRQLENAVGENDPAKSAQRRQVACQESWISRCQTLITAVFQGPQTPQDHPPD